MHASMLATSCYETLKVSINNLLYLLYGKEMTLAAKQKAPKLLNRANVRKVKKYGPELTVNQPTPGECSILFMPKMK